MKLKDVLAISGKPGLFIFVSQGRNGIIIESILDKKRLAIYSTTKVSALEDIAIYTETEEVPLKEIFLKIHEKENGQETISHKAGNEELKNYFKEILPDYDKERVYVSDIKKLFNWYNLLIKHKLLNPEDLVDEDETDSVSEQKNEDVKNQKEENETKSIEKENE